MNNDLISREALKTAISRNREIDCNAVCDVLDIIDNAPTVEYPFYQEAYQTGCEEGKNGRPQGEWINEYWEDAYQEYYHTCSICEKEMRTTHYDNFCPNCGAKMKGGAE